MSIEYKDIEDNTTTRAILKVLNKYDVLKDSSQKELILEDIIKALDEAYDEEIKRIFGNGENELNT